MTSNNRRHLARVRNAFLGATALAGIAMVSTPASAIIINDNFSKNDPSVVDDGGVLNQNVVNGVGQMVIDLQNGFIGLCTVSLINPRTVIFASHCVNENAAGTGFQNATGYGAKFGGRPIGFFFNTNNNAAGNSAIGQWLNGVGGGPKYQTRTANNAYNSNFVTYNTNCCTIGLGNNFLQSDVAMAALDTPAIGIPTWTMLFSPLAAATHSTIIGYGTNGNGTGGANGGIDFKRRVAENVLSVLGSLDDQDTFLFGAPDGLPANLYMMDFNDPKFNTAQANQFDFNIFHDQAYTHEGITAPGDSGGPLVIDHQFAAPTIAAVLSGGDRFFNAQPSSSYGTTSFYQPLYLYWDWIVANNPYKYVGNKAGNGQWTDPTHWVMNVDPAYMTIGANGQLVNALPTTPALGQANVPPGFGTVCYFDDCINIVTGAHTNPTPPAGPNPANGEAPAAEGSNLASSPAHTGTGPFGGLLGQAGFDALVSSYISANSNATGGPEIVSASTIEGSDPASQPAVVASGADGSILTPNANALSNWTNPENSGTVGSQTIIGLPGTTLTSAPNNFDGNPGTAAPARYYDVTLAASGITTLQGASVVVDKLTINGASTGLTIAQGATLGVNIVVNSFAGTTQVDGVLNSPNGVQLFGGVLAGNGTVNGPVSALIGAIAPGNVGGPGTLTINGNVTLGAGSATVVDVGTPSDLLKVNGTLNVGGTLVVNPLATVQQTSSYTVVQATTINGAYNAVTDTLPGVLFPVVNKVGNTEVVSFQAGSFASLLNGGTADQITIAAALDASRAAHYNDMLPLYQAIDPLSGAALTNALEGMAPDAERAAPLLGDMMVTGYNNMLWQHMGDIGGGANGQTAGLTIDGAGLKSAMSQANPTSFQSMQLMAFGQGLATNPGGGNSAIPTTGTAAAASPAQAEGWWLPNGASGFLSGSSLSGSVRIGGGGGRADVRGLLIGGGLDMPVGDGFTVGLSVGYSDASAQLRALPQATQADTIQVAGYGRYDWGPNWEAEAFVAYGHQAMSTYRVVFVGPTGFVLRGHTGGDNPSAGIGVGRSFRVDTINGAPLVLTPNLSLTYLESNLDPFTETGGAPAMTFSGFDEISLASRLGIDAKMTFDLWSIRATPNVHLAWVDNFAGKASVIEGGFAASPGAIMVFAAQPRDRSYGELGAGLDFDLGDFLGTDAVLSGRYDGNTRDDVQYGAWTGRLTIHF